MNFPKVHTVLLIVWLNVPKVHTVLIVWLNFPKVHTVHIFYQNHFNSRKIEMVLKHQEGISLPSKAI